MPYFSKYHPDGNLKTPYNVENQKKIMKKNKSGYYMFRPGLHRVTCLEIIIMLLAKFKRASRVLFCFWGYLVLICLNDKIIRYMFQAKNQRFLFYFNYLEDL